MARIIDFAIGVVAACHHLPSTLHTDPGCFSPLVGRIVRFPKCVNPDVTVAFATGLDMHRSVPDRRESAGRESCPPFAVDFHRLLHDVGKPSFCVGGQVTQELRIFIVLERLEDRLKPAAGEIRVVLYRDNLIPTQAEKSDKHSGGDLVAAESRPFEDEDTGDRWRRPLQVVEICGFGHFLECAASERGARLCFINEPASDADATLVRESLDRVAL